MTLGAGPSQGSAITPAPGQLLNPARRDAATSGPLRIAVLAAILLVSAPLAVWADCAADCAAAYYSCAGRSNPDSCLSQQGICLNRCTVNRERHGAIAYSASKEVYGYSYDLGSPSDATAVAVRNCRSQQTGAGDCKVVVVFHDACGALALGNNGAHGSAWGSSRREASAKALAECRPYGGASCKIERQVCSGTGR